MEPYFEKQKQYPRIEKKSVPVSVPAKISVFDSVPCYVHSKIGVVFFPLLHYLRLTSQLAGNSPITTIIIIFLRFLINPRPTNKLSERFFSPLFVDSPRVI
jgi:hypothetical protein